MPTSRKRKKVKLKSHAKSIAAQNPKTTFTADPDGHTGGRLSYDGDKPPEKAPGAHRLPLACYACSRHLPGHFIDSKEYIYGIDYIAYPEYMCELCASVLAKGDAIIKELDDTGKIVTGNSLMVDMTQDILNLPMWLDRGIKGGQINVVKESDLDRYIQIGKDKGMTAHPAMAMYKDPVKRYYAPGQ